MPMTLQLDGKALLTKLAFRPGIKKSTTDYAAEGAWIDMDKARFVDGFPQKIGGWEKLLDTQMTGTCRGLMPWRDDESGVISVNPPA